MPARRGTASGMHIFLIAFCIVWNAETTGAFSAQNALLSKVIFKKKISLHSAEDAGSRVLRADWATQHRAQMSSKATELPVTWSNRLGLHLTPITTGIWAAEKPFIWNSIDVGGRSVIARMPDGTLLVHSPVGWTEDLGKRIDRLGGGVGHIISPNYEVRFPPCAALGICS